MTRRLTILIARLCAATSVIADIERRKPGSVGVKNSGRSGLMAGGAGFGHVTSVSGMDLGSGR